MTWKNSNYSSADMMSMQQDAMRRVREMQRIANEKLNGQSPRQEEYRQPHLANAVPLLQENKSNQKSKPFSPAQTAETEKKAVPQNSGNMLGGLLSQLNLDNDRLIILLLLVVLLNEGADHKLLLALCYLLL